MVVISAIIYLGVVVLFRWNTFECAPDVQTAKICIGQLLFGVVLGTWTPTFLIPIAVSMCACTYYFLVRGPRFEDTKMSGKVVIVTGSNTGIGFQTALQIAKMGATVIMGCRTAAKAKKAVQQIIEASGNRSVLWLPLDLLNVESIKTFVHKFKELNLKLHVLINNAGMLRHDRKETKEGNETTLCANHLGPFLLTHLLLDKLEESKEGRIVNVNSSLHHLASGFDFKDPQMKNGYEMFSAYGRAKLACLMCTYELDRKLRKRNSSLTVNCLHPGQVMTDVSKNMHWLLRYGEMMVWPLMYAIRKTAYQGAFTSIHLATSPSLRGVSGKYFVHCRSHPSSKASYDKSQSKRVWELTTNLLGL
eukprot:CAMPEP_0184488404 /NCGR_PEP_ID=MMETSP0113_2-20130426/11699_1 /TAXON_ID=91329 /ORGANISM="Norrisiella sphaerica, Strain BC52" /LENGTH=361 /DNA_ID=CAMNT_0026871141 /DNA_START=134 /DNA_END=1219 /DNA_ORIENTATION=+